MMSFPAFYSIMVFNDNSFSCWELRWLPCPAFFFVWALLPQCIPFHDSLNILAWEKTPHATRRAKGSLARKWTPNRRFLQTYGREWNNFKQTKQLAISCHFQGCKRDFNVFLWCSRRDPHNFDMVWHGQSEKGAIFSSLRLSRCRGRSATWHQASCWTKKVQKWAGRCITSAKGSWNSKRTRWYLAIGYQVQYMHMLSHAVVQIVAVGKRETWCCVTLESKLKHLWMTGYVCTVPFIKPKYFHVGLNFLQRVVLID